MKNIIIATREAWLRTFRASPFKREERLRARKVWLRFASGLLLAALISSLLWFCLPSLAWLWSGQFEFWQDRIGGEHLGLLGHGYFAPAQRLAAILGLPAPLIKLRLFFEVTPYSLNPQNWQWQVLASLLLVAASFLGPLRRLGPALTWLRLIAGLHVLCLALSWFRGAPLIRHSEHLLALQHFNISLLLITPFLLACSFYLMESSWRRRITGSAAIVLYQIATLPFQVLAHSLLLHLLGPLAAPLLFLLFGPAMSVLAFAALFGWVMSREKPRAIRQRTDAAAPQAEQLVL